jgi:hypothetical protein
VKALDAAGKLFIPRFRRIRVFRLKRTQNSVDQFDTLLLAESVNLSQNVPNCFTHGLSLLFSILRDEESNATSAPQQSAGKKKV